MSDTPSSEVPVKNKTRVFFPNLNGVRALAALMVVVSHIELHKILFHVRRIPGVDLLNFGKAGVSIFFALSGFLITYLLLEERRNFTTINFKGFYIRRLLRIWPLYFLVVAIGFSFFGGSTNALLLSVLFLPNLAFCLQMLPAIYDPIWSIGTEEQFYIFHPHFFRIKKTEHILYALCIFIICIWALQLVVDHLVTNHPVYLPLHQLMYYSRFDNMMIGAVIAVLYHNKKHPQFDLKIQKLFNKIFRKRYQMVIMNIFLIYLVIYLLYDVAHGDVLIALFASLLIVNLCETENAIFSFDYKILHYVGNISYGMYLLHKFVLFLVLYLVQRYLTQGNLVTENIIIYGSTIALTVAVASASYYGYEKPFLSIKKRFQKITQ
ncbi:acyltransferase family protein [Mucilaginibacter ginsenosidivorax]|uniref:Acyltransferase n=1 Tax=Mucilaginibacter ginsenosidivorax TaxID=862126 RepID=A0A5B8VS95_9SPHI|nr:acyltransferase [Mucilaginibacter ginsenosidivorax]QEC74514.1 acyltransferase [Mucilaginibacter ginsenosidivorax]